MTHVLVMHFSQNNHQQFFILWISFLLLIVDPPKITQHPKSKSVATGASTSFTVEAPGDDLQFKWRKDGKDLHDGSKYRGTNTDTLPIKDVEKSDEGRYQCLVKNIRGEELSEDADVAVSKLVMNVVEPSSIIFCGCSVWFGEMGLAYVLVHLPSEPCISNIFIFSCKFSFLLTADHPKG